MKIRTLVLSFLLLFYSLLLLATYYSQIYFLMELVTSLLPYWLGLNILIIVIIFGLKETKGLLLNSFLILPVFLISLTTALFLTRFLSFTLVRSPEILAGSSQEIKIAFFNKYYSNTNYGEIEKVVSQTDPDLLGFAEFDRGVPQHIPSLNKYQCYLSQNSRNEFSLAFYSKYPCKKSSVSTTPYILSALVDIKGKEYQVFITHPYPPINQTWMEERNQAISQLINYVKSSDNENILILGDFNLTPWSKTFQKLTSDLSSLKNASRGKGLYFTWHGLNVNVQIDHIFVPQSFQVEKFASEKVEGSDHNFIWTQVRI